ncbi:MAG: hypothetical protein V1802_03225 [Candidatus Aenigmatarchaeota archaeon]
MAPKIQLTKITSLDELKKIPPDTEILYHSLRCNFLGIQGYPPVSIIGNFQDMEKTKNWADNIEHWLWLKNYFIRPTDKFIHPLKFNGYERMSEHELEERYAEIKNPANRGKDEIMGFNLQTFSNPDSHFELVRVYRIQKQD